VGLGYFQLCSSRNAMVTGLKDLAGVPQFEIQGELLYCLLFVDLVHYI